MLVTEYEKLKEKLTKEDIELLAYINAPTDKKFIRKLIVKTDGVVCVLELTSTYTVFSVNGLIKCHMLNTVNACLAELSIDA